MGSWSFSKYGFRFATLLPISSIFCSSDARSAMLKEATERSEAALGIGIARVVATRTVRVAKTRPIPVFLFPSIFIGNLSPSSISRIRSQAMLRAGGTERQMPTRPGLSAHMSRRNRLYAAAVLIRYGKILKNVATYVRALSRIAVEAAPTGGRLPGRRG